MAVNITGLVKNLQDSLSGLGDTFKPGDQSPTPYPNKEDDKLSQIVSSNWTKSFPYVFGIMDTKLEPIKGNKTVSSSPIGGKTKISGFDDFPLPINPSELTQDEAPAISIIPTQGGTVVTHNGMRYKELVISGTTGVHPNRGTGGASVVTGKAIAQPNSIKYRSGYESFLSLRNWMRKFYIEKERTKDKEFSIVFKNFKDGEFLIVELMNFTTKRSATKPIMYDYNMAFKVLGHVTFKKPKDKLPFRLVLEEFHNLSYP